MVGDMKVTAWLLKRLSVSYRFILKGIAHLRFDSARWPAHAATANQLTRQDDSRPDRPLIQGVRSASVPASIGDFTRGRPPGFPLRTQTFDALIGNRRAGSPGFRPLAPLPSALVSNQRTFADRPGFARPFLPSSSSPKPRLRAERIGGVTSFDLSSGVLGNEFRAASAHFTPTGRAPYLSVHFPPSNDRRESTFRTEKCRRAADAQFPPPPARVRHATERHRRWLNYATRGAFI